MLDNTKPITVKVLVLHKDEVAVYSVKPRFLSKLLRKNYKYYSRYELYVNDSYFDTIMSTEDPNIKLEQLRQQLYND